MPKKSETTTAPEETTSSGVNLSGEEPEGPVDEGQETDDALGSDNAADDPSTDPAETAGDGVQGEEAVEVEQPDECPVVDAPAQETPAPAAERRYHVKRNTWLYRMIKSRGDTVGTAEIERLRLNVDALVAQGIIRPLS